MIFRGEKEGATKEIIGEFAAVKSGLYRLDKGFKREFKFRDKREK